MFIEATCPSCGRSYKLAAHLQGKTVKCKGCQEPFLVEDQVNRAVPKKAGRTADRHGGIQAGSPVPASRRGQRETDEEEGRPRSRRRDDEGDPDDDPPPRRKSESSFNVLLLLGIVGGVVLLLVVVAGAGLFFVLRKSARPATTPVAQNTLPGSGGPQQPQAQPLQVGPPGGDPQGNRRPGRPPQRNPPGQKPLLPEPVAWAAQPDPGPDLSQVTIKAGAALPLVGVPQILFPTTPSAFAALRQGLGSREVWQVIDLQRFQVVSTIPGQLGLQQMVLSPDGKYLSGSKLLAVGSHAVPVISVADKRVVQNITLDTKNAGLALVDFLDNDRLLTFKTHGLTGIYEVFDIATGQSVKQFTVPGLLQPKSNLALSPGRKYLAIAHDNQVDLYHAGEGQLVGRLTPPPGQSMFEGLAFSPDGKELACLMQQFGSSARMLCWKMTSGELAVEHSFAKDVKNLVPTAFGYQGEIVQWVPDGSGWLVYGAVWIDRGSGAVLYQVPRDPRDPNFPRRLLGRDHLVMASPAGMGSFKLAAVPLPSGEIAAAARKAPTGGNAPVAVLPEPKAADLAGARMLAAPAGEAAWTAKADPAPTSRSRLGAVQLECKAANIQHILLAAGDVGQAVVLVSTTPDALSARRVIRAERYDLSTGRSLGGCSLFATEAGPQGVQIARPGQPIDRGGPTCQAAVSPEGARLAVRQAKEGGRLDVWDLAGGKHLIGWKPHEGDNVEGFAFLDANRLLTSGKGKLILWKVPECQAVYVADGYRGSFVLSPGRKLVAAGAGTTLEVLDAATGERQGQLRPPADAGGLVVTAAYRPDGQQLAAVFDSPGGKKLVHWDLSDGRPLGSTVFQGSLLPLSWAGPRHILQGNTLYSLNFPAAIALYTPSGPGLLAEGSPDGRCWFAAQVQGATLLTAQSLPDELTSKLSATLEGSKPEPINSYQLQVNGPEKFSTAVQNGVHQRLQTLGWKQGAGGVTIQIAAQGVRTGQMIQFGEDRLGIGRPTGNRITIAEFQVTCRYSITDAQGTVLAKNTAAFKTPDGLTTRGNDFQAQLDEAVWNGAISWGAAVFPPANLYRIDGKTIALPQPTTLVPGK